MTANSDFTSIYEYVSSLPVFSDHEHHERDEFFAEPMSLEKLLQNSYVSWTATPEAISTENPAKLIDEVKHNSYFIWFEKGLQQVHGLDEPLSADNWEAVSQTIARRYAEDADFHWRAMQENGYERHIQDVYWDPGDNCGHPELFTPTFRIDQFMYGHHAERLGPNDIHVWKHYEFQGGSLDDFEECMRTTVRGRFEQGKVAALKCAEAYARTIDFLPDDKAAAQDAFGIHPNKITREQWIAFGNYMFNRACELAGELDVPFQIHTGLGDLAGSNPMNFEPVLAKYPDVRFVLFHAGYPWTSQVAALAHNYRNALPSMTWLPIISTTAAIRTLHEFLDLANDCGFITWGSDCRTPEESVGAMLAWKFVVAKVLTERLNDGLLCTTDIEPLARKLMHENNRKIYALS